MAAVYKDGKHIVLRMTPREAGQLFGLVDAADRDGDYREWAKSAGATAAEQRALSTVKSKVIKANAIANTMEKE